MTTEYCAASSADSENFQRVIAGNWWEAALEYADENEDEINDFLSDEAQRSRALIEVGVGTAHLPVRLSDRVRNVYVMQDVIKYLIENEDDYQLDYAEEYWPVQQLSQTERTDSLRAALRDLGADIADAFDKFDRVNDCAPKWFCVDRATDISLGLAEDAARCAALIDMTGKLRRHPDDGSRWIEAVMPVPADSIGLYGYDLWAAADFLGIPAPPKPKGWRL